MADELQNAFREFRAFLEPLLATKGKNIVAGGEDLSRRSSNATRRGGSIAKSWNRM
jgi:hypothetical protein